MGNVPGAVTPLTILRCHCTEHGSQGCAPASTLLTATPQVTKLPKLAESPEIRGGSGTQKVTKRLEPKSIHVPQGEGEQGVQG